MIFDSFKNSTNQSLGNHQGHTIVMKREDQLHPIVSGNKFRKLKYVFESLPKQVSALLTFGGAFSNHLAATAATGAYFGVQTIGIVRGEEWQNKINESETLSFCQKNGMKLHCISRASYSEKENAPEIQALLKQSTQTFLLPEGGLSNLAVQGCEEILNDADDEFEAVCVSVGTGATLAGLRNSAKPHQKIIGFPALQQTSYTSAVNPFIINHEFELQTAYTFGGYAKVTAELIDFMNQFYQQYGIPLDPVYTGKMLFGIFDLIKKKKWVWGKKILVIHTGGLQGIAPMNRKLASKALPLLRYSDYL
ncbi:MAG: 1-aminocyclopropane-1-carboxylate deaminase/D-cysteine desulfhydrase [Flavobacteriaceae bacterium]